MQKISVVIMAAGKGSRMKSDLPKVLHSICGKSMLEWILDSVLDMSDDIHIILYHQASRIQTYMEEKYTKPWLKEKGVRFKIQDVQNYPGTGGALMQGALQNPANPRSLLGVRHERVLVLNGDMPLLQPQDLHAILQYPQEVLLSVIELDHPFGYGRVVMEEGRLKGIVEEKDASDEERGIHLVNAGVYVFSSQILNTFLPQIANQNAQAEYYLTDLIALCVQNQIPIQAVLGEAQRFMGVNSKAELARAECLRLESLRQQAMDQGVIMHMPESIYIDCDVEFIGECEIEQGARIVGKSVLKNAHIRAYSVIENSVIENSDVGPMAHIRPKCEIIDTHVGNFVETKAARLVGVKVGHLSYLGDCEIGRGSNVGAGVITCNYDGKQKHKTLIGENVFIGSDSQLIAPLEVQSCVLIAAGSTVVQNAKSGDLVISRKRQKNIPRGYFKFF